ncbi:UDP-4-amino-4,6-dideoxy-N-acetyl-beta-L-altrosamine N-acetyltransferase [Alkanindiges hydrocarboniclasticus]|jgi:UDP-4-amino-4,6-dideoxy-N-acetyl-beta-L-altrosamine N-acetyltransferase|uniref:UDP-4-amino-4, 6-dideoxy-N-acetyl-beta-L-altrosamine N-acetyltransferase n=1 Tax=Alkanindiges hydrocarboniclasticus TaxID=1907941 RepID=A0A1S8CVR5_9GAMM|nr:UDP-4-amino-4,6-dideoxy-N-acetyl-beta-L-altrosamine N-acetyltransferase [Alkanindiges hydrocarboniclasticus]ONG40587.1 UDP-4-amino-4,6-dideoxy-N-acetyl-beta-L-altrosamine N-acetyltransferase [Alkanindiges hydrocarboniclasticus]
MNTARIRYAVESDLPLILSWRNHPSIKKYMYTQHDITMQEHKEWFERCLSQPEDIHLLMFLVNEKSMGFINFSHDKFDVVNWGFYISPDAPKGTGYALGLSAIEFGFKTLKFRKICGQVLSFNERSINFHKKLGFSQEGIFKEQFVNEKNYYDVYHFGLLKQIWAQRNDGN